MLIKFFVLLMLFGASSTFALSPGKSFVKKDSFGATTNYRDEKQDIDLTTLETDIVYSDLDQNGIKEMNELFESKKEFGKLLGLSDWTPVRQKVFSENDSRTFVLEGHYKDSRKQTVNFLEVYWANKTKSGQFLVTSNSKKINLDDYKKYFTP